MEYNLIEIDRFGFDPEKIKGYIEEQEEDDDGELIKCLNVFYDGHIVKVKDENNTLIEFLRKNLNVNIIMGGDAEDKIEDEGESKKISLRSTPTKKRTIWEK